MKEKIKNLVEAIPYPVGKYMAMVPFKYRLGSEYTRFSNLVKTLKEPQKLESYAVKHFSDIFEYAKSNIPFYKDLYKKRDVLELKINSPDDIKQVPIITKESLREHVDQFSGAMRLNTGGTAGSPFSFYVDKNAFAREWAHMHFIWSHRNYNYREIKLTFRGKNLGKRTIIYNPIHNEFVVNTHRHVSEYIDELVALVAQHYIKFLHGYPSTIYSFLKEVDEVLSSTQKQRLRQIFKTCLLGSEFPMPYMKDYICQKWGLDVISWYGHSEMCILAYDILKNNNYQCLHTYGYAEVEGNHLIGTSYHNYDMPLIRYDTGDIVDGYFAENNLLTSFSVTEGRNGDYVEDAQGKMIALTGLIFGRHHEIFSYSDSVQVFQKEKGKLTFLVTSKKLNSNQDASYLFDLSGVDIECEVIVLEKPVLTPAGKMPLKVT